MSTSILYHGFGIVGYDYIFVGDGKGCEALEPFWARLWRYSDYFVDLDKEHQEEIINRTEQEPA